METRTKFDIAIEKLSISTFKMNTIVFAFLWIIYCIISFGLSIFVFGGWTMLLMVPVSFLFHVFICITGLVRVGIYTKKTKKWWIKFYPTIFIVLILIPQILFALFNTINDCGDQDCSYNPNFLASKIFSIQFNSFWALVFSLIGIISFFAYIAGLIGQFQKIFSDNIILNGAQETKPLARDWRALGAFLLLIILIVGSIGLFISIQLGYLNNFCNLVIDQKGRGWCYLNKAESTKDKSFCDKILGQWEKDICYYTVAISKKDTSLCNQISSQGQKDECFISMALDKNDSALCNQIQDQKDKAYCYNETTVDQGTSIIQKPITTTITTSMTGIVKTTKAPILSIGDSYQGGKIAYILQPGDPGYVSGVKHGLIAARTDQGTDIKWHTTNDGATGAIRTALGTGLANTNAIIALYGKENNAARLCYDLSLNGYTDWYLPSQDELDYLYQNKTAIGGFTVNNYWTSSETEASSAWAWAFSNGTRYGLNKDYAYYVRCVRSF